MDEILNSKQKQVITNVLELIDERLEDFPSERCALRDEYYDLVEKIEMFIRKAQKEITIHNYKEYLTVGVFKSLRSGEGYKVKESYNLLEEKKEFTCDCKGFIYNRHCKHVDYVHSHGRNHDVEDVIAI